MRPGDARGPEPPIHAVGDVETRFVPRSIDSDPRVSHPLPLGRRYDIGSERRQPPQGPLLLTGATGFLGMQLLARYLDRTDRRVYALVRARDELEAGRRLRATVAALVPDPAAYAHRIVAVPGDITLPGLGLAPERRDALAETVGEIVHAAASVAFELPLERSREINVEGTRRMLAFADACARRGALRRFSYVSTAYVAGTHRGAFGEDDLDLGQQFRNPYERSKFEAERLVRARADRLPIQIFRPSIVVGEQTTGWTPSFNVIYWPIRAFSRGTYAVLPAKRRAPVDVVPVDFVADAIFELSRHAWGAGETYHLAAGPGAATVGQLIDLSAARFNRRPPRTLSPGLYRRLVHPLLVRASRGGRRAALERSEPFFPYFALQVSYETTRTARRLGPFGLRPTPLPAYFDRLVDYALATRWGKRPRTRAQMLCGDSGAPQTRAA
jgi:thioester reductase-like protein